MHAVAQAHSEVGRFLLDRKADFDAIDKHQHTALMIALQYDRRVLLRAVSILHDCNCSGMRMSRRLMKTKPRLNGCGFFGLVKIVGVIVDQNVSIEAAGDKHLVTALIIACQLSCEGVTRLLLDRGANANVEATSMKGWTSLMHAAHNGHLDFARMLLDHNANIEAVGLHQWTALCFTATDGHTNIARLLIDRRANVDASQERHTKFNWIWPSSCWNTTQISTHTQPSTTCPRCTMQAKRSY